MTKIKLFHVKHIYFKSIFPLNTPKYRGNCHITACCIYNHNQARICYRFFDFFALFQQYFSLLLLRTSPCHHLSDWLSNFLTKVLSVDTINALCLYIRILHRNHAFPYMFYLRKTAHFFHCLVAILLILENVTRETIIKITH